MADRTPPDLLSRAFVTGQLTGALLARALDGSGLTPIEFAVLSAIGALGPVSPGELAQRLGMPATTLSDYLARFRARKLVRRTPSPDDRRSYRLELSALGARRNERALSGLAAANRALAERVDGDARRALQQLESALRQALGTLSP